ncbi:MULTISPECIES: PQQ-binding-like beta-propeller repeat protein [unclassified Streptomyces]|uniref:outer membrane protein assembly factor BamB family protein n=1 Tax=unclassified Streptomyces TaxID=2593676 RepID=UPI00368360F3
MSIRRLWDRWFASRPRLRVPLAVVLVLALGAGGWQAYARFTDDDGPREWTKGPYGKAPVALGKTAPARPGEMVRRLNRTPLAVVGGLALYKDTTRDGTRLTARNVRTDRIHWQYGRDKELPYDLVIGDELALLWWNGGGLTAVDLRTGEPRWHAETPRTLDDGYHGLVTNLRVMDGTVLVASEEELWALSAADGKRRWRAEPPKGCERWSPTDAPFALGEVYVVEAGGCPDDPALDDDPQTARMAQIGLDADTGAVRWRFAHDARLAPYRPVDDATLVVAPADRDGGMSVTDVSGRRPSTRTLPFPDGERARGNTARTLVSQVYGDPGALRGYALDDGRRRWTHRPPKGTRLGEAVVADGRVYVVEQPPQEKGWPPPPGPSRLLVLDAERGELLHFLDLPELDGRRGGGAQELVPSHARNGVVTVSWDRSSRYVDVLVLTDARP